MRKNAKEFFTSETSVWQIKEYSIGKKHQNYVHG